MSYHLIAIDGPAGSGKSTISKKVASELGFTHLDTGAMYRAITHLCLKNKIDINNQNEVALLCEKARIEFHGAESAFVFVNGRDVSTEIRLPEVTAKVSTVAQNPAVRRNLVKKQREIAEGHNCVIEGRDTTTVVFPDAFLKIYLDASAEERARRRHKELIEKGLDISYEDILAQQLQRDEMDSKRELSPLKIADDAQVVDTTGLTVGEVVSQIISCFQDKLA